MSSIQERLQLKRVPLDTWSTREKLCLASAVVRSGDQNWMSVSRALKTIGDANRPADWYSQKSCAAQYGALLEHVETPKRKKRSSEGAAETPQESILKRLTAERVQEIQDSVAEMNRQYEQLKNEIYEARNPITSEDRLREMWTEIEASKRAREKETARRAAWLKEREERRARAERTWRPPVQASPGGAPSSPLLTSLLKSSPVVTTPQSLSHPANVIDAISPSAGAPTLSMLLESREKTSSVTRSVSPDNKHAAIEHIKSQLVQIERQLKEKTATPPPAPLSTPAVDIDDIEIKAEDVYAFRDIDIHIPPVTTMHKGNVRPAEKLVAKKDDVAVDQTMEQQMENAVTMEIEAKEEPASSDTEPPVETPIEAKVEEIPVPDLPIAEQENIEAAADTRIGFPTPEIKVIPSVEAKTEDPQVPDEEMDVDVNVEDIAEETSELPQPDPVQPPTLAEASEPDLTPLPSDTQEAPDEAAVEIPMEDIAAATEPPLPPEPEVQIPALSEQLPSTEPSEEVEKEEPIKQEPTEDRLEDKEQIDVTSTDVEKETSSQPKEESEEPTPVKEISEDIQAPEPPPAVVKEEPSSDGLPLEEPHNETDDDTPMEVSREEEKDGRKRRDYSRKKKPDSRTCSGSESAEASAPDSPGVASDADRQHRLWKKSVMLVYSRLCAHKYASLFLRPITDEEAPGYSIVIKRPMDLSTIRRNIESGVVRTTAGFQRDVLLMLTNALMYNSTRHSVYTMTKEMMEEAINQLSMLVAAQAHAGLAPVPPPPARRKRRRPPSPQSTPTSGT